MSSLTSLAGKWKRGIRAIMQTRNFATKLKKAASQTDMTVKVGLMSERIEMSIISKL